MGNESERRKTCFVVMGFGEKTDFQSTPQRVLDLNRTYEDIIEPAVTACDVECIRADKVIHSTVIDKPMYDNLLGADLVIADLSTTNANAIYELGVRHALRPHTTIVIADNGFSFPFDLNHLSILKYTHMGKEIGYREVMRMRDELQKRIVALLATPQTDSPVFLFLPALLGDPSAPPPAPTAKPRDDKSFADLMQILRQAKADVKDPADWLVVIAVLNRLLKLQSEDPYVIQQLALATYKSRQPDVVSSLEKAKRLLSALSPETSSDGETVGLWGAIHKRLWEAAKQPDDLTRAVRAYGRGYFIKDDYYNAINFAYLLNVRASISQGDDAIADRVVARRIRREVVPLCDVALARESLSDDERFWIGATKVEALFGLGQQSEAEALKHSLLQEPRPAARPDDGTGKYVPPAQWMIDTLDEQLKKLAALAP